MIILEGEGITITKVREYCRPSRIIHVYFEEGLDMRSASCLVVSEPDVADGSFKVKTHMMNVPESVTVGNAKRIEVLEDMESAFRYIKVLEERLSRITNEMWNIRITIEEAMEHANRMVDYKKE